MKTEPEDLACLYVLGQLDADQRASFEARLSSDFALVSLVKKIEAALDLRRGLLALRATPGKPTP